MMDEINYKKLYLEKEKELLESKRKIKQLESELEFYKEEVYRDSLTKLYNRKILETASGYDVIVMGDVDFFKNVNDTYGHSLGDKILVSISNILLKECDKEDIVCRWGGEEFLILLKNSTTHQAVRKIEDIKEKISKLSSVYGFNISMIFGLCSINNNNKLENAIFNVDSAMYESKKNGRNKITLYKNYKQ